MGTVSRGNARVAQLVERSTDTRKVLGSNPSTRTEIEDGVVTKPSVQTIQKIAKSLGVPMEELLK
jgi:transcriptional regulator with XRE-family HTH domain